MEAQIGGVCVEMLMLFLTNFFLGHDLVFFWFFFGGLQHMFHLLTLPIKERHYQTNPCSFFIWSHILSNVHHCCTLNFVLRNVHH